MKPVLEFTNPETLKTHRLWRFPTGYGVSAVQQPDEMGPNWSVAVVKFTGPGLLDFNIAWDHPMQAEQDTIFNDTPAEVVMVLVNMAASWPSAENN